MSDLIPIIVAAIFSGGFATALTQLYNARVVARKARLDERTFPAQSEAMFLGNAEKAVQLLGLALDRAESEIQQLKHERDEERIKSREKDIRIAEMEVNLSTLRTTLEQLQARLNEVQTMAHEVRNQTEDQ